MKQEVSHEHDPRIGTALADLRALIQQRYPNAGFAVFHRDDPAGIRLRTTVDVEDTDEVLDAVIDKLYELQVEQELPIYVIPVQPPARVAQQLRERPKRRRLVDPRPVIGG